MNHKKYFVLNYWPELYPKDYTVKSKRKHPYINAKVFKLSLVSKDKLWKKYSFSGDSLE